MSSTANLCDKYINELNVSKAALKSYGMKKKFFGQITTVKITENNNDIFMATIETAEPGSIIVLDGVLSQPCAWMGDRKAGIAKERGITGIIINGFVRDIEGLAKLDMGILALGSHPCPSRHRANKEAIGKKDVVLNFGEINWTPGHYVYVDQDGVIVSPRNLVE
ncbi:ribonuclease E activity regulator RraA [Psychrobacillus sp. NPDC093180]|uniref:ribonuclease E activity regulator RraA n=1 Tax=Psychrobacillus sp. NPDC093180 TaxID=3364489 RepID=UPI003828A0A9